jgi:hypothetical protein
MWWRGWVDDAATALKAAVRPAAIAAVNAVVVLMRFVAASRSAAAPPGACWLPVKTAHQSVSA